MIINITKYNAICNLGKNIEEIAEKAIKGDSTYFELNDKIIQGKPVRIATINTDLPKISNPDYDLRCNQLLLKVCEPIMEYIQKTIKHYGRENVALIVATTNSGVEEYEQTQNFHHSEIGNPAKFLKEYFGLKNFYTSVSTACSSGIKAFSLAQELLKSELAQAVIVTGVDSIAKVPIFGFDSLEILSPQQTIPFSQNRNGINIGEGAGVFILEKNTTNGIEICGIGETTDVYHSTTPDPEASEAINTINIALEKSNLTPNDIDYINLHGTGTLANDIMESKAIHTIFQDKVWASSTKPLTGHCLGAAAIIETALCCKLLENNDGKLYPHIYDNNYDENIQKIKLVPINCKVTKIQTCLNTSFGFGGTNTAMILRRRND